MWCQRLMLAYLKRTKKSTCCNNCTDQHNLSSIQESSIFLMAYLRPSGTSMMQFAEIANGLQQLTSFAKKKSVLDVCLGAKRASAFSFTSRLCRLFFVYLVSFNNNHREKGPSNKTPVLTKITNMGIWVVGTSNQIFVRGY